MTQSTVAGFDAALLAGAGLLILTAVAVALVMPRTAPATPKPATAAGGAERKA